MISDGTAKHKKHGLWPQKAMRDQLSDPKYIDETWTSRREHGLHPDAQPSFNYEPKLSRSWFQVWQPSYKKGSLKELQLSQVSTKM